MDHVNDHPLGRWIRLTGALAAYRAENFEEARKLLDELWSEPDEPELKTSARYLLAMSQWRQDQREPARTTMRDLVKYQADNPMRKNGDWLGQALVGALQTEATKMIGQHDSEDDLQVTQP